MGAAVCALGAEVALGEAGEPLIFNLSPGRMMSPLDRLFSFMKAETDMLWRIAIIDG